MATMMMKTFVKPILQVKPGISTGRGPVLASIGAERETEPLVDLSAAEYRLIMHCRGPESPDEKREQQQQGISAHSRNHQSKP